MSWNVVDSSGWIEYFAGGPNASFFRPIIHDKKNLLVPAVCVYEVCKVIRLRQDDDAAETTAAVMQQGVSVPLAPELAFAASKLAVQAKLAMADAMIASTAHAFGATLWTQDEDFKELPNVKYKAKIK